MDKNSWFNNLSLTHLRQELAVVNTVLAQLQYSESESDIKIDESKFESKSLRGLSKEELLERVLGILTKLKKINIVNSFIDSHKDNSVSILVDLSNKVNKLQGYKDELKKEIEKKQIDEGLLKHHSWFRLDERNTTFFLELQDSSVVSIPFMAKDNGNRMFWVFRILYEKWIESPGEPGLSKSGIQMELKKYDKEYSDREIKDAITKIRMNKMRNARLGEYIDIVFNNESNKYHLLVNRVSR